MVEEPQTVVSALTDAHVPAAIKAFILVVICKNKNSEVKTFFLGRRCLSLSKSKCKVFCRVLLKAKVFQKAS